LNYKVPESKKIMCHLNEVIYAIQITIESNCKLILPITSVHCFMVNARL